MKKKEGGREREMGKKSEKSKKGRRSMGDKHKARKRKTRINDSIELEE